MPLASFAATISEWHDFYTLAGGAAATLLGLLFVAVSLNLRLFTDPAHPDLQSEAVSTFSSFLYLVLIALVALMPDLDPEGLAWPFLIFSLIELVNTQREVGRARRLLGSGWRGYLLELAPTLCYLGVAAAAAAALLGSEGWLTSGWMVAIVATLLGSSTGNAWELLLRAATADTRQEGS